MENDGELRVAESTVEKSWKATNILVPVSLEKIETRSSEYHKLGIIDWKEKGNSAR